MLMNIIYYYYNRIWAPRIKGKSFITKEMSKSGMTEISTDERLVIIATKSLELLQARIEQSQEGPKSDMLVRETGEALKALAEGIECFKTVMRKPDKLIIPNYS